MAATNAQRTLPDDLLEGASELHVQALFGNSKAKRKKAKLQLRANSGRDPEFWQKLDSPIKYHRQLRANAARSLYGNASSLDYDEWEDRSDLTVEETQKTLTGVDDLVAAGFAVDTSLARMVSMWQVKNDPGIAERSMNARARGTEDSTLTVPEGVPLPISHVDWEISQRQQINSQNFGEDIETSDGEAGVQTVREDAEDLLFNGWGKSVSTHSGDFQVHGYRTHPDAISDTSANFGGGDWDTGSNILDTIDGLLEALEQQGDNDNEGYMPEEYGVWLYVPTNRWGKITRTADPRGDGNINIITRIEQDYPYIDVRHAGALPAGEAVMVVQDSDIVDLADAQSATTMAWDIEGGMATRFKTMLCRVPRVKSTFDRASGIVHVTGI